MFAPAVPGVGTECPLPKVPRLVSRESDPAVRVTLSYPPSVQGPMAPGRFAHSWVHGMTYV